MCLVTLYFIHHFVRSFFGSFGQTVITTFRSYFFPSFPLSFTPSLIYSFLLSSTIAKRQYLRGITQSFFWCSLPGFPFLRGRVELLHVPKWSESGCKTVIFPPYRFYPNKDVHVQLTVNHINLNDSVTVHHAITLWTENVNSQNFTVCAMQAGRNGNNFNPFATVDWMAYQGAPIDGVAGKIKVQKWWSGTNCEDVTFPKVRWNL